MGLHKCGHMRLPGNPGFELLYWSDMVYSTNLTGLSSNSSSNDCDAMISYYFSLKNAIALK